MKNIIRTAFIQMILLATACNGE